MIDTESRGVKKSWGKAALETVARFIDMGVMEFSAAAASFGAALATHNGSFTRLGVGLTLAGTFWAGQYIWKNRGKFHLPHDPTSGPR